jgi:hypothetical protein
VIKWKRVLRMIKVLTLNSLDGSFVKRDYDILKSKLKVDVISGNSYIDLCIVATPWKEFEHLEVSVPIINCSDERRQKFWKANARVDQITA